MHRLPHLHGRLPLHARVFNWGEPKYSPDFVYGDSSVPERRKGVAEKCTLCKERTDRGEEPMCVACCPAKARIYGDLDDPESEISQVIAKRHAMCCLKSRARSRKCITSNREVFVCLRN